MGLGTQKNFLLPENRTYFGRFKRYQKNLKVLLSNYSAIKLDAGSIENARKARRRFVERAKIACSTHSSWNSYKIEIVVLFTETAVC